MAAEKARLREEILRARKMMSPTEREEASAEIARKFLQMPEYQKAQAVGFYASKSDEVATDGLIEQALTTGKRVVLPVVSKQQTASSQQLTWRVIKNLADLQVGAFGVREPRESCPEIPLARLDLFVVPGVAFDAKGNRLGYGRGFYDRVLSVLRQAQHDKVVSVGLAFACQLVEKVPTNEFDRPVQQVLTARIN